jgi:hypothetical protein
MKVMCIDDSKGKRFGYTPTFKVGDILEVVATKQEGYYTYYLLKGHERVKEKSGNTYWNERRFAPLSEIDEMELVNERELQTT